MTEVRLLLTEVAVDPSLQLRDGLDMDRVKAMQEFEEEGGHLPPIVVVGDENLLADGHHRLEAADSAGRIDIEATRVPGGKAEAVALAIQLNDIATSKPLTRDQRNKGVKLLLSAGWTQQQIADRTGVHRTTVVDIHNALAMRGEVPKATKVAGGGRRKAVAVLPKAVSEKLSDTVLVRIADALDTPAEQTEMATAVAAAGLSEPRVREAVKAIKAGATIAAAVEEATPGGRPLPVTASDVARQAYQRLDRFLASTMVIEGVERDFWQVLDVLVDQQARLLDPTVNSLVEKLTEVATKTDHYATALRSGVALKKVSA